MAAKAVTGQKSIMIPKPMIPVIQRFSFLHGSKVTFANAALDYLLEYRKTNEVKYLPPESVAKKLTVWADTDRICAACEAAEEDGTSYSAFFRLAFSLYIPIYAAQIGQSTQKVANGNGHPDTSNDRTK